jgi:hypothetical protein
MKNILRFKTTKKGIGKFDYIDMEWNLSNQIDVDEFLKNNPNFPFVKAGRIVKNTTNTSGYEIEVGPEWKDKKFVLYLLVIDGKIVKGGKSKNPLPQRTYGAGTEHNWTMKGSPSETNYVYSQIFRKCLEESRPVEFYCFQVPFVTDTQNVFGTEMILELSAYEEYESVLNKTLMNYLNRKPIGEGNLMEQFKN